MRVTVLGLCVCVSVCVSVSTYSCKVRDVWEWLNCMHVDTSEGGAVMSRCGFRSVRYLEVKIRCKNALGPRIVSAVRSFGGGRFSEVANVLQVWDFQSVTQ